MGCGGPSRPTNIHIQKYIESGSSLFNSSSSSSSVTISYYLPSYNNDTTNSHIGISDLDFKRFLTKNNFIKILNARSSLVNLNCNSTNHILSSSSYMYKDESSLLELTSSGSILPAKLIQNDTGLSFSPSTISPPSNLFSLASNSHSISSHQLSTYSSAPSAKSIQVISDDYSYSVQYCFVSQRGYYPQQINKANQDSFLIANQIFNDFSTQFYGIFDGHGETGDTCSHFVSDNLMNVFCYNVKLFYFNTIVKILVKKLKNKFENTLTSSSNAGNVSDSGSPSTNTSTSASSPPPTNSSDFELDFNINYDLENDSDFDSDDDSIRFFNNKSSEKKSKVKTKLSEKGDHISSFSSTAKSYEKISYYDKMDDCLLFNNNFYNNIQLYYSNNNSYEDSFFYIEHLDKNVSTTINNNENNNGSNNEDMIRKLLKLNIKKEKISTLLSFLFNNNEKIKLFLIKFLKNFNQLYLNNFVLKKYLKLKIEKILILTFSEINNYLTSSKVDDSLSGTTSLTLLLLDNYIYLSNIGDSRALIISEKKDPNSSSPCPPPPLDNSPITSSPSHIHPSISMSNSIASSPSTSPSHSSNSSYLYFTNLSYDQTPYRIDECERIRNYGGLLRTMDEIDGNQKLSDNYPLRNFCFTGGVLSSTLTLPSSSSNLPKIVNYKNEDFNASFSTNHIVDSPIKKTNPDSKYYQLNNKIFDNGELVFDPLEGDLLPSKSKKNHPVPENHENDSLSDPPRVWDSTLEKPGCAFTRSIGDNIGKSLGILPYPEIIKYRLDEQDKFIILASDGIFEFLFNQNIVDKINKAYYNQNKPINIMEVAKQIVSESYRLWLTFDDRTDDITIILISLLNFREKSVIDKEKELIDSNTGSKKVFEILTLKSSDLNSQLFSSINSN